MTPSRWARIKEVFSAALEIPEAERGAYLESACDGDAELRREVERMLVDSAGESLPDPAADLLATAAELAPGEMLGQYRVEAKLGEGGMGVVYRAHDTRLHRQVALKVLPPEQLADPDHKQRLLREARAASALNHPNIVTVHEIGSDRGVDFIAMEYVEGQSLAQLIPARGLPAKRVLEYAIQIADALAEAHAAGVVHRDLKPANIMVNRADRIKLLDFGLARRVKLTGAESVSLSMQGEISGTPAYMSPEQAEGKKADERTDVFAFGAVLYEMLSGKRVFRGDSPMATLGAVMREEPPPLAGVPHDLDRVVALCLRKDPARRFQHIDDVKIQLQALTEDTATPEKARKRPFWVPLAITAVVLGTVGLWWWIGRSSKPAGPLELIRLTSDTGLTTEPALSPDGKLLAYASDRAGEDNLDIWMQQMGGGAPIRLTRDAANEHQPDFSPDGTQIAFRSEKAGGGIYVIPALGGEARLIATQGNNPRFSPDGKEIAYWVRGHIVGARSHSVHVVSSAGGRPRQLRSDFPYAINPVWAPDGNHLLFLGGREVGGMRDWWVTPLDDGPSVKTGAAEAFLTRWPTDAWKGWEAPSPSAWFREQIIFADSSTDTSDLWGIPISTRTWKIVGKPRQLTSGTGHNIDGRVSGDGQVVFASLTRNFNIWSLPLDANQGRVTGGLERLTRGETFHLQPSLSPDGRMLAFVATSPIKGEVILKDLATGKENSVFVVPRYGGYPDFSGDGTKIAFASGAVGEKRSIYVVPVAGDIPEMVCEDCGLAPSFSSDGTKILYDWGIPRYIGLLNISTRQPTQLLRNPKYGLLQGRFSPDDRWICFQRATPSSGNNRLMVVPFRGAAEIPESQWIPVTDGSSWDRRPRWSPDGNLIYFNSIRDGFQCLWAQRLDPVTKRPAGATFSVYHFHSASRPHGEILQPMTISVIRNRIAMSLQESTGNIWTFKLPDAK